MKRRDKGQVLVLVALAIFVLLGIAALGIDVGFMYSVRHELQRSADAGALAGASAFTALDWNDISMSSTSPRGIADFRAREFASKDKVVQTTLNPASDVAVSFPRVDHIEVVTSRTADLFFARIFGMSNRVITARAVAKAAPAGPPVNVNCVKPWAIPYPWNDVSQPGIGNNGRPITVPPNGLYDRLPAPGETVYTTCTNGVGLCPGMSITLKSGSPSDINPDPAQQQTSGHFFIMQGNLGGETFQGSNDMRFFIREGCFQIDLTLPVDLMPGNRMGPTVQAVEDLINDPILGDPGARWDESLNRVVGSRFTDYMESPRVVRVVMYDPSIPMLGNSGGHGTGVYIQPGYILSGFFIEGVGRQGNEGWVTGRYMGGAASGGSAGGGGPLTGTEPKIITLVE